MYMLHVFLGLLQIIHYQSRLLGPLLKLGLPLMNNVLELLAKSVLVHFGLTAAVSAVAADAGNHKKL